MCLICKCKPIINRDDKKLFTALLINRQFSKKILSGNLKIFSLKYKGEV